MTQEPQYPTGPPSGGEAPYGQFAQPPQFWGPPPLPPLAIRPKATFTQAVKSGFRNYANFNGRAVNSEFWWWFVFEYLVMSVLYLTAYVVFLVGILSSVVEGARVGSRSGSRLPTADFTWNPLLVVAVILVIVLLLAGLALLLPGLAVRVRRLHDAGYSGWFVLLTLAPFGSVVLLALLAMESSPEGMKYGY
ncbi:DUF805 domain-containing protein [Arthrobacter sp. NPDC090010]|uniref:DUF805 domain-containing protein n=1 Tax=Arthrobacter sp. NPDC090010 TaxID=3363942 RepID=UPI00381B7C46